MVRPNLLTKLSNFKFAPPLKNSNSNVNSDSSFLPIFSTNSSIFSVHSLRLLSLSLIVSSTSGKILCNSSDNCFCPIGGNGIFFGVISIVYFFHQLCR